MLADNNSKSTPSNKNEFKVKLLLDFLKYNFLYISDKHKYEQITVDIPGERFKKLNYYDIITIILGK